MVGGNQNTQHVVLHTDNSELRIQTGKKKSREAVKLPAVPLRHMLNLWKKKQKKQQYLPVQGKAHVQARPFPAVQTHLQYTV